MIGGGPSGSAAAVALARSGLTVALLERTHFDGPRVGELIAPEVTAALHSLGLWRRFTATGPLPARGLTSVWGTSTPEVNDHLHNPYGRGWLVDRQKVDRLLFDAAAEAGAQAIVGATARSCRWDGKAWTVETTLGDRTVSMRSRYVVDATGRTRGPRRGARRRIDRLVACVCYLRRSDDRTAAPLEVVVEAQADGWWFSAPLPNGILALTFLTDADLLPSRHALVMGTFWRSLERTALTWRQLPSTPTPHAFFRCAADSHWWPAPDVNRIAVGDALIAMDPLCGRGLHDALESGRRGAAAIVATEQGDRSALMRFTSTQQQQFRSYLAARLAHYRGETRWPSSPFWARRLGASGEESEHGYANSAAGETARREG